ncbi:MAG: ATP-dependent sacrificial sulfur transferase LarE [Magnetococcus sp. DMHC-8]
MTDDRAERYRTMLDGLRGLTSALVAFSGGVDSTFLVAAVQESGIPYLAVTALSPTMPARDREDVAMLIRERQWRHRFIDSGELDDANFVRNTFDRCYFCKSDLFGRLTGLARQEGWAAVLDGSTTDDLTDYRPGMQAKRQFQVRSPILEAGLGKEDVRWLSREMGLKSWDKPASPCLSSRISYGEPIHVRSLQMVEEAETRLRALGFGTMRVRKQGETARIELPEADLPRLLEPGLRQQVITGVRQAGFTYVSLDLEGFQSGRLNRVIPIRPAQ